MTESKSAFRPDVHRALPAIIGVRLALNIGTRMAYTFLPAFARGTGLSIEAMSTVLSGRELTSLSAPLTGKASDRLGPLTVMSYGGFVAGVGLLLASLGALGLIVGMIVFGFGRTAHQVALNAWIGGVVAYERRGRATGLIELTWGGAALVGLPLTGLVIGDLAWWVAPAALGVMAVTFSLRIRKGEHKSGPDTVIKRRKPHLNRFAVAAIGTNGSMNAAAQFLFLGHGLWLEDTYGLDTAEIGLAIVAVGTVEVIATTGSSHMTDRLGKRRSMIGGTSLMTTALVALAAYSAPPLWLGLALLVVAFLGFEYGIVSAIPLMSELDPGARAEMVGLSISFSTVVRAVVTLIASTIYLHYGFAVLMTVAASAGGLAIALALFAMVEPG